MNAKLFTFNDCKNIFDIITASKRPHELRLMKEIAKIERAYHVEENGNVAWICSMQGITGNPTRHNGNEILIKTMEIGRIDFVTE